MLRKRSKKGIIAAIGFATLALTTVGFSTWITIMENQTNVQNITVEVDDALGSNLITGSRIIDSDFCFDALKDDKTGPIVHDGNGTGEDLTVEFEIYMQNNGYFAGLTLDATSTKEAEFAGAIAKNYFVSPFNFNNQLVLVYENYQINNSVNGLNVTITHNTETTFTVNVKLSFSWGSAFGGKNPCEISKDTDQETIETYLSALTELKAINETVINFKISHPAEPIIKNS